MTEANRNLALRAASGVVLFPLVVWATWDGGPAFAALLAGAAALGVYELVVMFAPVGLPEIYGIAVAALIPVAPWLGAGAGALPAWAPAALPGAAILLLALHLFQPDMEAVPRRASAVALAWVYVAGAVAAVASLRLRFGFGWVMLAFVLAWANDTAAYFAGRFLGRHKMFPRVSPKKTWEGFAGGAAGSVAGALAMRALDPGGNLERVTVAGAVAVGLGAAILGPAGDLAESMLKRAAQVKDSGSLIPGHGGLLDRIDALLFVAPWVWAFAVYGR